MVIHLPRDYDLKVIAEPGEPSIKHPVRRPLQRDAIVDDIRSAMLNRPNMRRRDLGTSATIDELQPGHPTAFAISAQHAGARALPCPPILHYR